MATSKTDRKTKPKPKKTAEKPSPIKNLILTALDKIYLKETQLEFSTKILHNDITFCQGPAGTSKTFTACYTALKLYATGLISKIILVKSVQQIKDEAIGFLPGDLGMKLAPAVESYRSNFRKIIGADLLKQLEDDYSIEYPPLAFMRGSTFDRSLMILDEAQNIDYKSLILFITRMGNHSKALMTGDVSQHDIDFKRVEFPSFIKMLSGIKGVDSHIFSNADIVRNKILIEVTERYEKWKAVNKK